MALQPTEVEPLTMLYSKVNFSSQPFIQIIDRRDRIYTYTYFSHKWNRYARVFVPDRPFQPIVMQQSSLFDPFVNYAALKLKKIITKIKVKIVSWPLKSDV